MPTKKQQLQALVDLISLLQDQQIPHGVNTGGAPDIWNEDRSNIKTGLPLIGDFFADTDANHAALLTLFNTDHDPVTGKNPVPSEWVVEATVPVFVNASQFQLPNDRRTDYTAAQRLRTKLGSSFVVVAILGAPGYDAGQNKTTITVTPAVLGASLTEVSRGLVRTSLPKVQTADFVDGAVGAAALANLNVTTGKLADGAVVSSKLADGSVTTAKLADAGISTPKLGDLIVTTGKLAVGASLVQYQATANALAGASVTGGNELAAAVFAQFTPRNAGSRVKITCSLALQGAPGVAATTITWKVKRNGVTIANFAYTVTSTGGGTVSMPVPGFVYVDVAHGGAASTYSITVAVTGSGNASAPAANSGIAYVEELA